jgi:hypothetical protein
MAKIINGVVERIPVVGVVDADNGITIYGKLKSGEYFLRYENDDGSTTDIGSFTVVNTEPDEPDTEKTLTSIFAIYSGGSVLAGTSVNHLTGIVVTARYSDGTSKAVTGYTLSGTIAEGSNTITVRYDGMSTTFTVTGISEPDIPDEPDEPVVPDGYTNVLPLAINSDNTPYNNGQGWKTGYRLNSSAVETAEAGMEVTGFIPVKAGDVVRFANIEWPVASGASSNKCYVWFYNQNFTRVSLTSGSGGVPALREVDGDNDALGRDSDGNLNQFTLNEATCERVANWNEVAYMRISAYEISSASIITINRIIE